MLKYVGNGSFLPDIPARDLNDDEIAKYGGRQKLIATGLYADDERQRSKGVKWQGSNYSQKSS